MVQLTRGVEEVVKIVEVVGSKIFVQTTGPGDPAGRELYEIQGHPLANNSDSDSDSDRAKSTNLLGKPFKKSLALFNMRKQARVPCQYYEVKALENDGNVSFQSISAHLRQHGYEL